MNTQTKKPHRYCGRVEFLACVETVIKLQEKGYSLASIYDLLKEENKISIKYRMFCLHFLNYKKRRLSTKTEKDSSTKENLPALLETSIADYRPSRIVSKDEKFNYAPNPDTEINEVELFGADVLKKE